MAGADVTGQLPHPVPFQKGELGFRVSGNGRKAVGRIIDQDANLDLIDRRDTGHWNLADRYWAHILKMRRQNLYNRLER